MRALLQLVTLMAMTIGLPAWAADGEAARVNGVWKGAFDFQGNTIALTLNLKTEGDKVTGTVEGLPTTPSEIHDGAVTGDTLTFWLNSDYQGQTYKIVYKGKLTGDQIVFDFGTEDGSWSAPLTVKKSGPEEASAPSAPAAGPVPNAAPNATPNADPDPAPNAAPTPAPTPAAADVDGTWKGSFDLQGRQVPVAFHLKNAAGVVTGTIDGLGKTPVPMHDARIDGDTLTFWINADYQGQTYTVTYKGKVSADQIDFTFGTPDGSWSSALTARKGS